ncbi:hypothetical protein [Luteolibacter sp. Populi]|uniref:hypothetical protein n=1 Tax=Luteolibacter sp. Populi TaxID=3230487 RepID=UPI0034658F08
MHFKTLLATVLLLIGIAAAGVPGLEVKGPYSSIKRNKDGSYEEFSRPPDERTITKKLKSANHTLLTTTIYRLTKEGNPLTCDIFDGKGTRLFKSRYGYDKRTGLTYGKLLEEQMFDARVTRKKPGTDEEMPIRRFIYTYDARGNRNAPIAINLIPGKTAEEVFGAGPSGLQFDPFEGHPLPEKGTANPKGTRIGGK